MREHILCRIYTFDTYACVCTCTGTDTQERTHSIWNKFYSEVKNKKEKNYAVFYFAGNFFFS